MVIYKHETADIRLIVERFFENDSLRSVNLLVSSSNFFGIGQLIKKR